MSHRSFLAGAALLSITLLCGDWVLYGIVQQRAAPLRTVASSIELSDTQGEPSFPDVEGATSTSMLTAGTTTTAILHEPPIAFLRRVTGDPVLVPGERSLHVPILMYHRIRQMQPWFTSKDRQFTVTPEDFTAQMEGLVAAGYTTISPRDLEGAIEGKMPLPTKSVLLTFDDGYREHATVVLPILRRLHLHATYFIVSQAYHFHGYMTSDMIREADATGLITIADHTRHHVFLARMTAAHRASEIVGSKEELETLLGHSVSDFAYPYGSWNTDVAHEVEHAGYVLGFGIRLGSVHTSSSRYQLRRIRVLDGENVVSLLDAFSRP